MTAPLSDIRVIETGTLPAGPFCGQLLGDFVAEVIKWGLSFDELSRINPRR
ncbi:CoA transferase [Actinoplanes sp. NPDC026619]|uniref:CoA transferase n=1 Tax=Actinoplanes sp. NPDC026619 TaxID=3155798 RepID=UPI0033F6F532